MNVGIDLGGSHIGIGLVDSEGKIVTREESFIKLNNRDSVEDYIKNFIIEVLNKWINIDKIVIDKIGIGVPGVVINNILSYSVNLGLSNFDLIGELKKHFPDIQYTMQNDAKCAALAEKKIGALKEYDDCVFICLGTGIGGAAFYDGKIIVPKRSSGFEYGHMIIQKDGEVCKCGSKGCFEQYGSMRKLKNLLKYNLNLDEEIEGETLREFVRSNKENPIVKNVLNEYIKNLCIGISNIVNILEPKAICIGGGFPEYEDILLEDLKRKFYSGKYLFYKENIPEILIAKLNNDAGIIGSALFL